MIVNDIPLTLRLSKGTPLTANEADSNFTSLKQAILLISEGFDNGRVLVSQTYPPDGEAANTLLVLVDSGGIPLGLYIYNAGDWVRIGAPTSFYCTDTGTANAYVTAITDYPTAALTAGQVFIFKASTGNTGAATFKVNSLASTAIQCKGVALTSGQIAASQMCVLVYDGAAFELVNPVPPVPETPLFTKSYNSGEITIDGAESGVHGGHTFPLLTHSLVGSDGSTPIQPKLVRAVFISIGTDSGYAIGDEIPVEYFIHEWSGGATGVPVLIPVCTTTQIQCMWAAFTDVGSTVRLCVKTDPHKGSSGTEAMTPAEFAARWKLKVYAYA
jgi:hypothetical protein